MIYWAENLAPAKKNASHPTPATQLLRLEENLQMLQGVTFNFQLCCEIKTFLNWFWILWTAAPLHTITNANSWGSCNCNLAIFFKKILRLCLLVPLSLSFGKGLWAVCMQGSVTSLCSEQGKTGEQPTMQCKARQGNARQYNAMQGRAGQGRPGTIEQSRPCLGSRFGTDRQKKEWRDIQLQSFGDHLSARWSTTIS